MQNEVAVSLRKLADEIEAGDFKKVDHSDTTETVVAGVHKGIIVNVTTGKRRVTLDLETKNYRPVELGMLADLAETAWRETEGPRKLEVIAERLSPRATVAA